MSRVLRATPLMLNERSNILIQHRETDNQQGRPPRPRPHRTQARRPRVPCDIGPQYGIISTLKIPAVSSGATWTLSLRNFLWTCITQVQSTFATICIATLQCNLSYCMCSCTLPPIAMILGNNMILVNNLLQCFAFSRICLLQCFVQNLWQCLLQ